MSITGESGADVEEEELMDSVSVGTPLNELDGVVEALNDTGVEAMSACGQNAMQIAFRALGEGV
ncbi:transposase, IS21 family protein [Alcaligenes faecalis subsp. faecalis NCIB 8687]|nr:transposase, IS21 family protein [Alcaligenes faecalis subsp. faecalis NCIB 8687]